MIIINNAAGLFSGMPSRAVAFDCSVVVESLWDRKVTGLPAIGEA